MDMDLILSRDEYWTHHQKLLVCLEYLSFDVSLVDLSDLMLEPFDQIS